MILIAAQARLIHAFKEGVPMHNRNRILSLVLAMLLAMSAMSALAAAKSIAINSTNFPDKTFRSYIRNNFDTDGNKKLSSAEISKVKRINLEEKEGIKSLKGIEYFTTLTKLNCYRTPITKLDLRKNTRLKSLDVCETRLTSLKLGNQKYLANLRATDISDLKSIDIGGCPKLLKAVKLPYSCSDDYVLWSITPDDGLCIDTSTKLMNGKKVVRKYAKPTSFKFTKTSKTLKVDQEYNLWSIISMKPSTAYYPIECTSSDESVAEVWDGEVYAHGKGTTTITAKAGKKKLASIKVTVK